MMEDRLSIREMFALCDIDASCDAPFPSHLASDSRDVTPGGAFVALEGERVDGHSYIGRAIENGAGLIIGRRGKCPPSLPVPCVELSDPERGLGELAARYVERVAPREVIAVTGSVGKTTTREAIRRVLGGRFRLHSAVRSFNTLIGCSLTILGMPLNAKILLLEFGASSMGEIRALTRLFRPTIALITGIAPVHLAGFGSLEGVLRAKMQIAESDRLRYFLYDSDSPLLQKAALRLPGLVRTFGVGRKNGDYRIGETLFQMENGAPVLSFDLKGPIGRCACKVGLWGEKLAMPAAMAIAVGNLAGLSMEDCGLALRSFTSLPGRGRVLSLPASGRNRFVVDDAYNANPASMRSSLETFAALRTAGKKFAVLGDMRELGGEEVCYHKELIPVINTLDAAIFVGSLWKRAFLESGVFGEFKEPGEFKEKENKHGRWRFVEKWRDAVEALRVNTDWEGLLIKGSNSLGLENVAGWVSHAPEYVDG
ncbi:MAG: UDP-N-acetylmuramoyl-tripeptide--D-alanyl-D-alanine ligase [Synergistaceae bacterium]|nr:UDP-N-acetylmuramoyl-tripeptide--D-alanyl-D-alanine ligase [Synergistaceae bacterium]